MASTVSRYRVVYEIDETGAWIASVPSVPGCHTYGHTLDRTRARIREALGLFVDDANDAELVDDVRLPAPVRRAVERARRARRSAEAQQASAREETAEAVRVLTRTLRLGTRDAGRLLGLSHQRVQQLLPRRPAAPSPRRRHGPPTSGSKAATRGRPGR